MTAKDLYDKDFVAWCWDQTAALKTNNVGNLDMHNLAEEIESLGKSQKHALKSHLRNLMMHLLKMEIQPEYSNKKSWETSIRNARNEIEDILEESRSLTYFFNEIANSAWPRARNDASDETGVSLDKIRENIFTREEILKDLIKLFL